ncbi:MAG: hypothetical protein EON48_09270 [Acetobacteraceae bacterium]|nr:MAG: hypothetical protein EON48_09270 [Acetobacteraceae bacterium]
MSFNYSVNINDTIGYPDEDRLVSALNEALADFSGHMSGKGTLVTQLNIGDAGASRADGSSTIFLTNGLTAGGQTLVQLGSIDTLLTGQHRQGTASDITINLDRAYLPVLHFGDDPVPDGRVDAASVFRHELQHAFGMTGYIQNDGVALSNGTYMTAFDTFIDRHADGSAFFTGPTAERIYGGAVPLTTTSDTENFYHLANGLSDVLVHDLMTGVYFSGRTYEISNLDLAILKDVGAPVTDLDGVDFRPASQTVAKPSATPDSETPSSGTHDSGATPDSPGNTASIDWNAIGAAMTHYNEATGQWWNGSFDALLTWEAGTGASNQAPAQTDVASPTEDWNATQHSPDTGPWL